ncbi:MAG: EF-hand domain-containing protein [Pseudonocardiaceae bacterium]
MGRLLQGRRRRRRRSGDSRGVSCRDWRLGRQQSRRLSHAIAGDRLVFDTIDLDDDGKLSLDEFSLYLQAYGLAAADAATAFEHLDLDSDGYMSRDEFAKNMSEYYISEDRPAPSEWFFGGH